MSKKTIFSTYLNNLAAVARQGDAREESFYPALADMLAETARGNGSRHRADACIGDCAMNSTVYIETSVIGYLTSWPSRDSITAANQRLTRDWWNQCRENFDIFISQFVIDECAVGDTIAVKERLNVSADIQQLDVTEAVETLADGLIDQGASA